ncbi:FAD dependent oxidoreductase [Rhizodiscina lignyota]|uniref:FAD dependent oxidoreductase n=1 Tax=Rhizodiscina lignyota TaxID=1504668 RepID=A0A9P4M3S3_9PEZI|nr:FAD dependent oxidoreductase [Rhizodiscina lignyota]
MAREFDPLSRLPVPSSTTPFWRACPLPLDDHRSTKTLPEIVDIAIIGAGMSGACTAYHLLKNNTEPPSIVIFEARQACSGATGRNGGHSKISPVTLANFHKAQGAEAAAELATFHRTLLSELKACVERENIDCDLFLTRSFDVFLDQAHADVMENEFQGFRDEGATWLKDIQFLKGKNVERLTGISGAKGAASSPVVSLWPYKFVVGLLQKCIEMGANLQTHTPVTKISRESKSGLTILETPRGTTKAKKVVFATNAYVSALLPQYGDVIVPGRGTACHITAKFPDDTPQLTYTYNIHQSSTSREYLIPRPDSSIILGGGQTLYRDDKSLWFDTVDDSTLITLPDGSGVKERYFKGYMARHFSYYQHNPENAEDVESIWTGIMGFTPDGFPHIGEVPREEGWFLMAGFNGGGMASIFEAARGVVCMIQDGRKPEETSIPKLFIANEERLKRGFRLDA